MRSRQALLSLIFLITVVMFAPWADVKLPICLSQSEAVQLAITPPQSCAVSKPSDFVIKLPWADNVTHSVTNGYGGGLHQGFCSTTSANDYYALDFDLAENETVRAIASGTVRFADWTSGGWSSYGQAVLIDHGNGYQSFYAHLNSVSVSVNQTVGQGQSIGGAGGTGGWPVHLHFALYKGASVAGGPYGGQSTVPEPFTGVQQYENIYAGMSMTNGSAGPPPSEYPIQMYKDANYQSDGGNYYCYNTSEGWSNVANGCSSYDNQISSVLLQSGWSVRFFKDPDISGTSRCLTSSDDNFSNNTFENGTSLNDAISSYYLYHQSTCPSAPPSCNPSSDQVALYADTSYGGSCVTLNIGDYPSPANLGSLGNDNAESIRVGSNVKAILYEHDNYGGNSETFTSDDSNLSTNSIGANSVSSVKVQTRSVSPPSAPSLQSPSDGYVYNEGQSISLSWSSTGNEYYGEVWGGPGGTLTFGWQGGTSYNLGSQWAGYTYSWHVKARNSGGESGWSSTRTFTVKPATPTSLTAQAVSCNQINLSWNDNSGSEEGYKIYRNGSYLTTVGAGVTSYQNTGLTASTSYSYYVKAYRGSIYSDASNTASVATPTCPPQGDSYEPDNTSGQAKWIYSGSPQTHSIVPATDVDWVKFSFSQPSTVTLQTSGVSGDTRMWFYDSSLNQIDYDDDDGDGAFSLIQSDCLVPGTYYVKIDEYDNDDEIANYVLSVAVNASTLPAPSLSSPSNGSSTTDTTPTFSWNSVSGATSYHIQVDNNSGFTSPEIDTNPTSASYTAGSALSVGTYFWRVQAHNACGDGTWSTTWSLTINAPPSGGIRSGYTENAPTANGRILAGEWADARVYNITLSSQSSLITVGQGDLAEANLPDNHARTEEGPQPVGSSGETVTLYAMSDANHLYLAFDNPNDTSDDSWDEIGVYFDDNPLPSDGQWTNTTCGHPDGEGNYWLEDGPTATYREWIAGPDTCDEVNPAPGVNGAIGHLSGHAQAEIMIDLSSSALRATPGDTIHMYMWIYDETRDMFDGRWPAYADFQDPSTYGVFTLAGGVDSVYLPFVVK